MTLKLATTPTPAPTPTPNEKQGCNLTKKSMKN
jgi:hypothetical protein